MDMFYCGMILGVVLYWGLGQVWKAFKEDMRRAYKSDKMKMGNEYYEKGL